MHKLECVIRDQLFDEISWSGFDIGYIQGSHTVTIRSKEYLLEVWSNVKKGSNIILWCDGLKKSTSESKKGAISKSALNTKKGFKTRTKKYKQQLTSSLQSMVTRPIYLCNIVSGLRCTSVHGVHPILDCAPTSNMFNRAGGGGGSVKSRMGYNGASEVVSAISDS